MLCRLLLSPVWVFCRFFLWLGSPVHGDVVYVLRVDFAGGCYGRVCGMFFLCCVIVSVACICGIFVIFCCGCLCCIFPCVLSVGVWCCFVVGCLRGGFVFVLLLSLVFVAVCVFVLCGLRFVVCV